MRPLAFAVHAGRYAIVRLAAGMALPAWLEQASAPFLAITRTARETSLVCAEQFVPDDEHAEHGWAVLELLGPFPLDEVGILASVAQPLAAAGIALFAISTFETDYLLVRDDAVDRAREALVAAGHRHQPV